MDRESKGFFDVLGWVIFAVLWVLAVIFVAPIMHFYPDLIPFRFFEFWSNKDVLGGIFASWPIFAWGAGATFVLKFIFSSDSEDEDVPYLWDMLKSFFAGLLEEITYRWVFFFSFIVFAAVFDSVSFGIVHWFYINIEVPVVSFVTLGKMEWIFSWKGSWVVGAAALNTTNSFSKGHNYLGPLGTVNAWFLGWFFFYLLANYGILAAIVSHILYDIVVFTVAHIQDAITDS